MSSPLPPWTPGPKHWKITTAIAVGAVVIAAASAGTSIYTATKDQKDPTVRAIIDPPDWANLPPSKKPTSQKSVCNDEQNLFKGGWGPERPLFDVKADTSYATLNSVQNNPNFGDERGFYGIRESGTDGSWKSQITLERGKEYVIRAYINSDSKVAEGVRVMVSLPTCTGRSIPSSGILTSENAYPLRVWGDIGMTSPEPFNLVYVDDSARLYGNYLGKKGRFIDPSFLTSQGALVGSRDLDGNVGSGHKNALYFTFLVRPQFAEPD
ncbi:hypothetical protein AB0N56_34750 [Streptomyces microflavus]|uniref:hypothetical protein n=1 Tax=Streptomyces microflavus TaxID=1919 RepID=UPI0034136454